MKEFENEKNVDLVCKVKLTCWINFSPKKLSNIDSEISITVFKF